MRLLNRISRKQYFQRIFTRSQVGAKEDDIENPENRLFNTQDFKLPKQVEQNLTNKGNINIRHFYHIAQNNLDDVIAFLNSKDILDTALNRLYISNQSTKKNFF